MTFPLSVLGNKVEFYYNGRYNDHTSDVRGTGATDGEISISGRGTPDEASGLVTATANFSVNNRLGKYSPRNVRSELYGLIGPNTEVRISSDIAPTSDVVHTFAVPGVNGWPNADTGEVVTSSGGTLADYLVTGGTGRHSHSALSTLMQSQFNSVVSSEFDATIVVQGEAAPTVGYVEIGIRGRMSGSDYVAATVYLNPAGTVSARVHDLIGGVEVTTSTDVIAGLASSDKVNIRFQTLGWQLRLKVWEFGITEPEEWSIMTETEHIAPGAVQVHSRLQSTLTNTLPYDVIFSSIAFVLGIILFTGQVAAWPKKWDTTGTDVWVSIEANGLTRQQGQGAKPLRSPLFSAIRNLGGLIGYWDFENLTANDYQSIPSALPGGGTLLRNYYATDGSLLEPASMNWAANSTLRGSGTLPAASRALGGSTGSMRFGGTPATMLPAASVNDQYSVLLWNYVPLRADLGDQVGTIQMILNITNSPDVAQFVMAIQQSETAGIDEVTYQGAWLDHTGGLVGGITSSTIPSTVDDWRMFRWTVYQFAGFMWVDIYVDETLIGTSAPVTAVSGQPSSVYGFLAASTSSQMPNAWGHWAIASGAGGDSIAANAASIQHASLGYPGESTVDRLIRLHDERGVYLEINRGYGDDGTSAACGVQTPGTFLETIGKTAMVDDGVLYELRHRLGYGYRTRTSLYATPVRFTANYTDTDLSEVPDTTDDDQRIRNEIVVTRDDSGTSYTATQTTGPLSINDPNDEDAPGVGLYDTALRVQFSDDTQMPDYAGHRLTLGTRDESRWPGIALGLHRTPFTGNLSKLTAAAFLDIADIMSVINLPTWLPPDSLILQMRAVSVFLSNFTWGIEWNTLPGGPWQEVAAIGSGSYGRMDTTGAELQVAVDDNDTDLIVYTAESDLPWSLPYWTEDINELNYYDEEGMRFRLNPPSRAGGLGGEQVTAGPDFAVLDTFTRTASQLAGTLANTGQTWNHVTGTVTNATLNGSAAVFLHTAANTALRADIPAGSADQCASADILFSVATATGAALIADVCVRTTAGSLVNQYRARLSLASGGSGTVNMQLFKLIASVSTQLGTTMAVGTNSNTVPWRLKVMVVGSRLACKAWRPSIEAEPDWMIDQRFAATEFYTGTSASIGSQRATGNTNTNPTITFDNFQVQTAKIMPAYYDRYARTTSGGLGTADVGGTYQLWGSGGSILASDWNTAPNAATTLLASAASYRAAALSGLSLQDVSASLTWIGPNPTGADLYLGSIVLRATSISSFIYCRVYVVPTTLTINVEIISAAGASLGVTPVFGLTHVAATSYKTRAAAFGDQIMMKVWPTTQNEPAYWHLVVTDPATPVAGWVGWLNGRQSGNTNVNPTPSISAFRVDSPQRITVERGTNDAAVDWPVGTDIRLWDPMRLGR